MKLKRFVLFQRCTKSGLLTIATSDSLDAMKTKAKRMFTKVNEWWTFAIFDTIEGAIYDRHFSNTVKTKWHKYTVLPKTYYDEIKYNLMNDFGFNLSTMFYKEDNFYYSDFVFSKKWRGKQ